MAELAICKEKQDLAEKEKQKRKHVEVMTQPTLEVVIEKRTEYPSMFST